MEQTVSRVYVTDLPRYPLDMPAYSHYAALFMDYIKSEPDNLYISAGDYLSTEKAASYLGGIGISAPAALTTNKKQSIVCKVLRREGKTYLLTPDVLQYTSRKQMTDKNVLFTSFDSRIVAGDIICRIMSSIPMPDFTISEINGTVTRLVNAKKDNVLLNTTEVSKIAELGDVSLCYLPVINS